jgi:hypothetical protein
MELRTFNYLEHCGGFLFGFGIGWIWLSIDLGPVGLSLHLWRTRTSEEIKSTAPQVVGEDPRD